MGWARGVVIEATADTQVRRLVLARTGPAQTLEAGPWPWSRHPNDFGEITRWWGLWLFGVAAAPGAWWTVFGPLAMTGLFAGASVPRMDRRMVGRRPSSAARMRRGRAMVPLPARTGG